MFFTQDYFVIKHDLYLCWAKRLDIKNKVKESMKKYKEQEDKLARFHSILEDPKACEVDFNYMDIRVISPKIIKYGCKVASVTKSNLKIAEKAIPRTNVI